MERFECEEVRAVLANIASWSNLPIQEDTSAGAHPFGALHAWSGRTTARTVERTLRRQEISDRVRSRVSKARLS